MSACKKCKCKIGMFTSSNSCDECNENYCSKCSTELVDCTFCNGTYCNKCLVAHVPECKEENEAKAVEDDEEEVEEMDGITFNKGKTVCILDISSNDISDFIEELETLKRDFILDTELSTENSLVWFKK